MREIKFRAWDVEDYDWAYFTLEDLNKGNTLRYKKLDDWSEYTGLKDKNGKEIYEGDIVKTYILDISPIPLEIQTDVIFHEGTFAVLKMNNDPLSLRDAIILSNKANQGLEIIGNIYEDGDVLK